MGNIIKRIANSVLSFFKKVGNIISEATKKICTAVVNGAKKVIEYFKKIYVYESKEKEMKVITKAFYYQGHQYIQTLTGKKGIPALIQFFKELSNKKVIIKDENNKEVDFVKQLNNIKREMADDDMIKVRYELSKKNKPNEIDRDIDDFDVNEDSLEDILELKTNENLGVPEGDQDIINLRNNLQDKP